MPGPGPPASPPYGQPRGNPFYIDADLYEAWGRPGLVLDIEPGFPEGFSLPAGEGTHFVVRTSSGQALSCPL